MDATTVTVDKNRPNRLLIALAAAWMIVSLAIGGAASADSSTDSANPAPITGTATQP